MRIWVGTVTVSSAMALMATPTLSTLDGMGAARAAHAATSLADGRVLITGGFTDPERARVSAELFDPRTRRFLALPAMRVPRHSHAATRLADGRVLITGGYGADGEPVTTNELFDPATGRFVSAGSLRTARAGHVAVLLPDSTVLVAGGVGVGWRFLDEAERYDPRRDVFERTGAMREPRESHVAVLLGDGRVLVVGGHVGRREQMVLHASAELYDPRTGQFRPTGAMRTPRHKHDAVRLADGRVLVVAGSDRRDSDGVYRTTEIFDSRTDRFLPGPEVARPRYKHQGTSVVLRDGRVLLAGGAAEAEVLDVNRGVSEVVTGGAILAGQFSAVALLPSGEVLITGGYGNGRGPRAAAWRFSP